MSNYFYKGFTSSIATLEDSRMDVHQRKVRENDITFALAVLGTQEQAYAPTLQRDWNYNEIKYLWTNNCSTEAVDECDEACADIPAGRKPDIQWTTLPKDFLCIKDNFTIDETELLQKGIDPSEEMAKQFKIALSNIEKKFADNVLVYAMNLAGTNQYHDPEIACWDANKKQTLFPKGNLTASNLPNETDKFVRMIDYMESVAVENQFSPNWFMFDIGGMFKSRMLASKFQQDGNTDVTAFSNNVFGGHYKTVRRKINVVEKTFGLKKAIIMVDPNSFSVVNTHYYRTITGIGQLPSEMMESDSLFDMQRKFQNIYELNLRTGSPIVNYAIPMPTLTQKYNIIDKNGKVSQSSATIPMYADVTHQYECTGHAVRSHNVQIVLRYQYITRPLACDPEFADNTGILVFAEDCDCTPTDQCAADVCSNIPAYNVNLDLNGQFLTVPDLGTILQYESGGGYIPDADIASITVEVHKGVPGLSTLITKLTAADLDNTQVVTLENGGYFVKTFVELNANGSVCPNTLISPTFDIKCPENGICDSIAITATCDGTVLTVVSTDLNTGAAFAAYTTGFLLSVTDVNGVSHNYVANDHSEVIHGLDISGQGFASAMLTIAGSINYTFPNGSSCTKYLLGKDVLRCDLTPPEAHINC